MLTTGPEWSVSLEGPEAGTEAAAPAEGFGSMLGRQITNLAELQEQGAAASASLAAGTATDPASVVMSVERARLSMQLAAQLRTKGVEAINDVFHTQV
jgi:flagellar hook-basal body complex protein FliE